MWKFCIAMMSWKGNQAGDYERTQAGKCDCFWGTMMWSPRHKEIAQFTRKHFVWVRERGRVRGGEVISFPEHIHFTVFSSTLPLDITSLPFKWLSLHSPLYMWQKAFTYTHTYRIWAHTTKRSCKFPMTSIKGWLRFSSAVNCTYR